MNKAILMGRLVRDVETRYTQGHDQMCISRYTLAVDRNRRAKEGEQSADFIPCVAFGKAGEFAEKYFRKGMKVCVSGHIQTGSYTNKDGAKVYTTEIMIETQEFAESKSSESESSNNPTTSTTAPTVDKDGFMTVPDGLEEELPFF